MGKCHFEFCLAYERRNSGADTKGPCNHLSRNSKQRTKKEKKTKTCSCVDALKRMWVGLLHDVKCTLELLLTVFKWHTSHANVDDDTHTRHICQSWTAEGLPVTHATVPILALCFSSFSRCALFTALAPEKTSWSFHWIKVRCVCLLFATGSPAMNYRQRNTNHDVYTTPCRGNRTTHHLVPATRDGFVYIKK